MATADPSDKSYSARSPLKWWHAYRNRLSASYLELIAAESSASRILHFHPMVVPGLLQTREYALAVTPATALQPVSDGKVEMLVDVRMRRQHHALHAARPAQLVFLLEETSIRRPVGSAKTVQGQLDHLLNLMDHPAVTIIVLPSHAPAHPGVAGPFMLMQYAETPADDVLCFEGPMGNVMVRDRPDFIAAYGRLAERLQASGLSGRETKRLIISARDDFT